MVFDKNYFYSENIIGSLVRTMVESTQMSFYGVPKIEIIVN